MMDACFKASQRGVRRDSARRTRHFKKIYERMETFRDEQLLWFQVAEKGFDNFMHPQSAGELEQVARR